MTRQGLSGGVRKTRVCRCSGEVEDGYGCLDLQCFQAFSRCWRGFGDLPDRTVGAQQLRKLDALQIVADVAPRVAAGVLGGTFEQKRQYRESDVSMNPVRRPVEHRTQLEPALWGCKPKPQKIPSRCVAGSKRNLFSGLSPVRIR